MSTPVRCSVLRQPCPSSLSQSCCSSVHLNPADCFSSAPTQVGGRLKRLNQAGKLFLLQTVEQGAWVGMVAFDSAAYVKSELVQINSAAERDALTRSLPTAASGGTSICSGLRSAFTVRQVPYHRLPVFTIVSPKKPPCSVSVHA